MSAKDPVAFDSFADDYLRAVRNDGMAAKLRVLDQQMVDYVARFRPRAVLEMGAGDARLLAQIEAERRVAADASGEMLAYAVRRSGIETVVADNASLPFEEASFDAVVAGYGGHRYPTVDEALASLARVLKAGGHFALHDFPAVTWGRKGRTFMADGAGPDALRQYEKRGLWIRKLVFLRFSRIRGRLTTLTLPIEAWQLATHVLLMGERMTPLWTSRLRNLREALQQKRSVDLAIAGGSMEPRFRFGQTVQMRAMPSAQRGDVVAVATCDGVVVHRIVVATPMRLLLQGDARGAKAHWVMRQHVLGMVDLP